MSADEFSEWLDFEEKAEFVRGLNQEFDPRLIDILRASNNRDLVEITIEALAASKRGTGAIDLLNEICRNAVRVGIDQDDAGCRFLEDMKIVILTGMLTGHIRRLSDEERERILRG